MTQVLTGLNVPLAHPAPFWSSLAKEDQEQRENQREGTDCGKQAECSVEADLVGRW